VEVRFPQYSLFLLSFIIFLFIIWQTMSEWLVEKTNGLLSAMFVFMALPNDVEYAPESSMPFFTPTPKYFPGYGLVCSHDLISRRVKRL